MPGPNQIGDTTGLYARQQRFERLQQNQQNSAATTTVPIGQNSNPSNETDYSQIDFNAWNGQLLGEECRQNMLPRNDQSLDRIKKDLTDNKTITPINNVRVGDKVTTVYMAQSVCVQGKAENRYYVMDDTYGKVKFIETDVNGNYVAPLTEIEPETLENTVNTVNLAMTLFSTNTYDNIKRYGNGESVFEDINGYTSDDLYSDINLCLGKIDSNNIIPFLRDYYEKSGYTGMGKRDRMDHKNHGLIQRLDDEHDNGAIEMTTKLHVIRSLLDAAEKCGLTDDINYEKLSNLLDKKYNPVNGNVPENFRGDSYKGSFTKNNIEQKALRILECEVAMIALCAVVGGAKGAWAGRKAAITAAKATGGTGTPISVFCVLLPAVKGFVQGAVKGAMISEKAAVTAAIVGVTTDEAMKAMRVGPYKISDKEKIDDYMYNLYKKIDNIQPSN